MRNLVLAASSQTPLPSGSTRHVAIDVDENVVYVATESQSEQSATVPVNIIRYSPHWEGGLDVPEEHCALIESQQSSAEFPHVLAFKFLPESRKLVLITRNGDITTIDVSNGDSGVVDVEGTVEPGITAAAWSPDDTLLVLVTGEEKVILMTSTFDVLSEESIHASDFGEDAPINVGWGSKQTQFHGSLGKAAAQAPTQSKIGTSPDDDGQPRVSWRGDAAFYVVSTLSQQTPRHRVLRVYDIQGRLQSTSEAVAGVEHVLSWRPSGNLIASTQRFGFEGGGQGKEGRHDVVFFERNGLRHGEFTLPVSVPKSETSKWGYKVQELSWSPDSDVLAVWIRFDTHDVVQLWTIGNYHWYLKHEVTTPAATSQFSSITWHPENSLHLILGYQGGIMEHKYSWDTTYSRASPPQDSGNVAVIDGQYILLTPFRSQNVPPPMSSSRISLTSASPPTHMAFSPESETLAMLWENPAIVEVWNLNTRTRPGRGDVMRPELKKTLSITGKEGVRWRQVAVNNGDIAVLGSDGDADLLGFAKLGEKDEAFTFRTVHMMNGRLVDTLGEIVWQSPIGELFSMQPEIDAEPTLLATFPRFCFTSRIEFVGDRQLYIGRTASGKLYVTTSSTSPHLVASNTTSWTVASNFLIYTTTSHDVLFAPLPDLLLPQLPPTEKWEMRKIERGSKIVVPIPSSMSLVLQMPRGNLETINPRPLVMAVVKKDLEERRYKKAFGACRKHRIDLNVLVDVDRERFLRDVELFVEAVGEVDDVNLFLTTIGRGSSSPEAISEVCDKVRAVLEEKDLVKYVNSILTAYVVKSPPDHEAGLALLLRLRSDHPDLVEDAVKYIIFLVDAERLYNTALGMYDFSLVLMIAQHSQRDPREYLPFLRELQSLDKYTQRFKIDDLLKRHTSALKNLSLAGDEAFAKTLEYAEQHQLFHEALTIWKGTEQYSTVLNSYGDWFFDRREYREATAVFIEAGALKKAMVSQERALDWQDLFDLAFRTSVPKDEVEVMAYRVSDDLAAKKRFGDAGRVLLDYASDIQGAIKMYIMGNQFSEARRLMSLHSRQELLETNFYPGLLECQGQILEDIGEMKEQLRKQVARIEELRVRKLDEPDAFYGVEDTALHNVDVMTDASMPFTAFTRYTAAPTTTSRTSKKSSKTKRKMERKIGSGRKGTVDEEEYLLKSIAKLVTRFQIVQGEARNVLPHLFQATSEHREAGQELQEDLSTFETELVSRLGELWKRPGEGQHESWEIKMAEKEQKVKNPLETVAKPVLGIEPWRITLLNN